MLAAGGLLSLAPAHISYLCKTWVPASNRQPMQPGSVIQVVRCKKGVDEEVSWWEDVDQV